MTIVDFAKEVGVSTATVSRAFSDKGRISVETRRRVLRQAEKLGYRPNLHARQMVTRRSDTLGFLYSVPPHMVADYYTSEIISGITETVNNEGLYLQVNEIPSDIDALPTRVTDLVHSRWVDGLIVYTVQSWTDDLAALARRQGMPVIVLDNVHKASADVLSVGPQIEAASEKVGAYLRRIGRRQPAFVHGIHDRVKLRGFRRGLESLSERLVTDPGGMTFQDGYDAYTRLSSATGGGPDALFCANDVLAVGAMRAARDRGRSVPGDVAVVGCDDLQMARFVSPALTTIRLPKHELGRTATQQLVAKIREQPVPPSSFDCPLILRESA